MQSNIFFVLMFFFACPNNEQESGDYGATHTRAKPDHLGHGSVMRALCKLIHVLAKFICLADSKKLGRAKLMILEVKNAKHFSKKVEVLAPGICLGPMQ